MTRQMTTHAALLTPLAPGAIAVIGLQGPETDAILSRIIRAARSDATVQLVERRPTVCRVVDGSATLDDAVVVRLHGDGAELCIHGGVRITQNVLSLLTRHGVAIVNAEQLRTAWRGPIEKALAEALLKARSRRLAEWLIQQRDILPPFLERIARLSPDERTAFEQRSRVAIRLLEGMRVALVGPPNAGKSTLANQLIGGDPAITSDQAGTTRDWVSGTALIRGWPLTLVDTAGIRKTGCDIEGEAIRRTRAVAATADLAVIVIDATQSQATQQAQHEQIAASLPDALPRLVVHNKCDDRDHPFDKQLCRISALQGRGLEHLEQHLAARLGLDLLEDTQPAAFEARWLQDR